MSSTDTERRAAVITPAQVRAINRARTALAEIQNANHYDFDTQASGMMVAMADTAGDVLFQLLNWYQNHGHGQLSDSQLHNRVGA
jgi:hypothetical protein